MFKFIKEIDTANEFDTHEVVITVPYSDADLDALIDAFECFLKASGFIPKGRIELVKEEIHNKSSPKGEYMSDTTEYKTTIEKPMERIEDGEG